MAKQAEFDDTTARPVELPDNVRRLFEDAIQAHLDAAEALILALDEVDGDADFEPDTDAEEDKADLEPSLGWTIGFSGVGERGGDDDREAECEDEGACETAMEVL